MKCNWVRHGCRMSRELRAKTTTVRIPSNACRGCGRYICTWRDELDDHFRSRSHRPWQKRRALPCSRITAQKFNLNGKINHCDTEAEVVNQKRCSEATLTIKLENKTNKIKKTVVLNYVCFFLFCYVC